ncbi:MAG TPA: thioredoxin domain-containing protein, partial [Pyrinomonadaceae bacterium]|nr:thioredoxin domain-containing protein [Pyrinomonadaceae bacterium]
AKVADPTETEVQAFYDQNKAKIRSEFKDVKEQILAYLRDQRQREEAKKLADRLRAGAKVQMIATVATPPATAAERSRVFAVVNDRPVTSADVEDNLRPLVYNVQEQVYQLRRTDVELKINDILLEQEAQKRKVTTKALLDAEVVSKVKTVTEADAQAFFNQNKERINGDFATTKGQILQYLQDMESRKAEGVFADQLRRAAAVQVFLKAPEPPVFDIATDDQPMKGNPAATVTLVEFTDFQCPSCAQTQPTIEKLATEYADRVRFVIRDYPLTQHENAFKAAEAAEAAREQGKYWEYVNILFLNQSALQVDKLKAYATQLGLDRQKFDAALESGRFADQVYRDLQDGVRVGVNSTPTVFVNGRRADDRTYEGLKALLEAALKNSPKK